MESRNIPAVKEHLLAAAAVVFLTGLYRFFSDENMFAPVTGAIIAIILLGLRSIYGTHKVVRTALIVIFAFVVGINFLNILSVATIFGGAINILNFGGFLFVGMLFAAIIWAYE